MTRVEGDEWRKMRHERGTDLPGSGEPLRNFQVGSDMTIFAIEGRLTRWWRGGGFGEEAGWRPRKSFRAIF